MLWAAWPLKTQLERGYRHLPRLPIGGGTLLDIGCGDGSFLQVAQTCGWDVIGIDPDPKVVANCRSQGWNVLQGDIEQFYDKERLFDVITMNHVIEHVHDPLAVLKACHRLLKPGGQLWLETPNIDSFGHLQYGRNWRGLEPPRHLLLFNQRSLLTALLAAGFTSVERKGGKNQLPWITWASEAIKRGQRVGSDIPLSKTQRLLILKNVLLQAIAPSKREFLTVGALKKSE